MKKNNLIFLIFFLAGFFLSAKKSNAQCIIPTNATIVTTVSTCINNGSITIHNVTGGSQDSTGVNPLVEYSIVASSNPKQMLITWQNDSLFNNLYPGTYTVAIRYNCGSTGSGHSDSLVKTAAVAGNYQSISVAFLNIITSFCNNGGFTVNASNGYKGITGTYTYQLVSAQNAVQPDPSALSTVQTSNVFSNLAAGNYFVRVFDDCGNFVTGTVIVPQGIAINPFASAPTCSVLLFSENKYGCNDSTNYFLNLQTGGFSHNITLNNTNFALPGTSILFYPDGTSDTAIVTSVYNAAPFGAIKINNFINSNQLGPFYVKWIDACGNTFTSFKAQFDTTKITSLFPGFSQTPTCAGTKISFGAGLISCNFKCPTLVSGTTYSYPPQVAYSGSYNFSIDNGITWHLSTDTVMIPCSSSFTNVTPRLAFCGDTINSCTASTVQPCAFKFPATEVNSFACNGNSGMEIMAAAGTSYSNANAIKIVFDSIPVGQAILPVLGINQFFAGNKFNNFSTGDDFHNYLKNLLPGKYVYTVTDTICGKTYTDSITLIHPHQYVITNINIQPTCTNASVAVTISNNSFYAAFSNASGDGSSLPTNNYTLKLLNSSNSIVQTQHLIVPVTTLFAATNGTVITGTATFTNVPLGSYGLQVSHDSTQYYYLSNPCGPLVDSVTVVIGALDISSSIFLNCGGTAGSISINAIGGVGPYTYELYDGTVSPANLLTTQSSPLFTGLNSSQTYSVRVIDNCGTGTSISKSFSPYAVVLRQLGSACLNNNLTLYTDTLAGATYSWTKNGSPLPDSTTTLNFPSLSTSDYGTYAVTVSVAGCNNFSASRIISAALCMPLSVQLVEFIANAAGNKSRLNWVTSTEINNAGFAIERSADGINWQQIGFVASKAINNNSTEQLSYTWYDNNPLNGINYYQLKQIDIDGNSNYSNIETVSIGNNNKISVQPNPVTDKLYIITNNWSDIKEIKLLDATGRTIYQITNAKDGINMNSFATGMYMLQIIKTNSNIQTEKIIKK